MYKIVDNGMRIYVNRSLNINKSNDYVKTSASCTQYEQLEQFYLNLLYEIDGIDVVLSFDIPHSIFTKIILCYIKSGIFIQFLWKYLLGTLRKVCSPNYRTTTTLF